MHTEYNRGFMNSFCVKGRNKVCKDFQFSLYSIYYTQDLKNKTIQLYFNKNFADSGSMKL